MKIFYNVEPEKESPEIKPQPPVQPITTPEPEITPEPGINRPEEPSKREIEPITEPKTEPEKK